MRVSFIALVSSAALLFTAAPAFACGKNCGCHHHAMNKTPDANKATTTDDGVLAPVDEVLSATCSCSGPGDCTCKKGECKCKKCSHHMHEQGEEKTQLLEPLNGQKLHPVLPADARLDATAGEMI